VTKQATASSMTNLIKKWIQKKENIIWRRGAVEDGYVLRADPVSSVNGGVTVSFVIGGLTCVTVKLAQT
jgi:hypothetical protein